MKKILFPLLVLLSLLLSACSMEIVFGSGKIVSSERAVSDYTQVVFDAPGELTITQDGDEALTIEGDDNLLGHIKTEVEAGVLHIYVFPVFTILDATQPIRYTLSVNDLDAISLNGSGTVKMDELKTDRFALNMNGSGKVMLGNLEVDILDFDLNGSGSLKLETLTAERVTLDLDGSGNAVINALSAEELRTTLTGSGEYRLNGKVIRQDLRIIGSGKYDAEALESRQADVSVVGSGDSEVWATETLSISIVGSGDVGYMGKPDLTQQVTGSGDIYSLD